MKTLTVLLHIHGGSGLSGFFFLLLFVLLIVALCNRKSRKVYIEENEEDYEKGFRAGIEIARKEARHE